MASIATVLPEYAEVLLNHLELEITDELKKKLGNNNVRLSILLDKKGLDIDPKEFSSKSRYVIADDGTNIYHLCIGYVEDNGKTKKENVESLAKATEIVNKENGRKLKKLNEDIESKKNQLKFLEGEISKLEGQKNICEDLATDAKDSANKFLEKLNKEKEEYEELVGKIESLRENFLVRVLFHLYKLELE